MDTVKIKLGQTRFSPGPIWEAGVFDKDCIITSQPPIRSFTPVKYPLLKNSERLMVNAPYSLVRPGKRYRRILFPPYKIAL